MGIARRRFVMLTVVGAVAAGAWQLVKFIANPPPPGPDKPPPDPFVVIIRKKLPYLRISDDEIAKFGIDFRTRDRALLKLVETDRDRFVYEVCSKLLMSSDFFFNGADVSRPVRYRGYYDPYKKCQSPFARV